MLWTAGQGQFKEPTAEIQLPPLRLLSPIYVVSQGHLVAFYA